MPIVYDIWNNEVEMTPSYVAHRNRLIDVHLIHTFQTKGKRLLINTFKQNSVVPTMCIFFPSKENAEEAYRVMKQVYYPTEQKALVPQQVPPDMDFTGSIVIGIAPLILLFFVLFSKYLFTEQ
jgi:hypothetical protein